MPGVPLHRFEAHALGRAFHAARVVLGPRARSSALHGHADFYELMMIVEGHGDQRLGSGVQQLHTGDIVLARPSDQHAMRGTPGEGMTFVNVAFPAGAWRSFVDLTRVDPQGAWDRSREPPNYRLRGTEAEAAAEAFDRALIAFHRHPTMLELTRFWSDIAEVIGHQHSADPGHCDSRQPAWLTRACAAMRREENLREGVPRLLTLAMVSPAHLSRTMRVHNGKTPTRFVTDLRLAPEHLPIEPQAI